MAKKGIRSILALILALLIAIYAESAPTTSSTTTERPNQDDLEGEDEPPNIYEEHSRQVVLDENTGKDYRRFTASRCHFHAPIQAFHQTNHARSNPDRQGGRCGIQGWHCEYAFTCLEPIRL